MNTTSTFRPWLAALILCSATGALAAPPNVEVRVGVHPPPMRVERVPGPRPGYTWTHGYWGWRGGAHVWIGGGWVPERPGYHYIDARWVFVDGAWAFYPAYWEPIVAAPPVVVVQQPPVTYIEQPQPAPQQTQPAPAPVQQQGSAPDGMDPNYWYYCRDPAGYFPYVQQCSGSWQQVTPQPQQSR